MYKQNENTNRKTKEAADETAEKTNKYEEEEKQCETDKETDKGLDQNSDKDQDSDVSFQEDIDEASVSTQKEEVWIEYIKRITKEAEDYMNKMKLSCWIEIYRRLKWRMANRMVSLPE